MPQIQPSLEASSPSLSTGEHQVGLPYPLQERFLTRSRAHSAQLQGERCHGKSPISSLRSPNRIRVRARPAEAVPGAAKVWEAREVQALQQHLEFTGALLLLLFL